MGLSCLKNSPNRFFYIEKLAGVRGSDVAEVLAHQFSHAFWRDISSGLLRIPAKNGSSDIFRQMQFSRFEPSQFTLEKAGKRRFL
ncbi:hypothetical protein EBU02_04435 [bacterium]|nr:hypothetical protein [bacterium]